MGIVLIALLIRHSLKRKQGLVPSSLLKSKTIVSGVVDCIVSDVVEHTLPRTDEPAFVYRKVRDGARVLVERLVINTAPCLIVLLSLWIRNDDARNPLEGTTILERMTFAPQAFLVILVRKVLWCTACSQMNGTCCRR